MTGLAAVALGVAPSLARGAEPARRYKPDADEMAWMKSDRPAAAEKLERGEALLQNAMSPADVEKAASLFAEASRDARESSLAKRRECQALTALGRHDEAVSACEVSLTRAGTFLGFRAMAGALMSGPYPPSSSDVGRALFYARRATENAPEEPWGYAAECDVGRKLGDVEILNRCSAELVRVAPGHYETDRALRALAAVRPGFRVAAGWILFGLAAAGSLAHWARRRFRGLGRVRGVASASALGLVGLLAARPAAADPEPSTTQGAANGNPAPGHLSKYPIDEKNPESSIPTPEQRDKEPLEYGYFLMDLGDAATAAAKRGDHLAAAQFYRAMVKAVPDAAIAYRKTCEEYEAAGDLEKAKGFCAGALTQGDAIVADYSHYARVVFARKTRPDPADVANIDSLVAHLEKDDKSREVGWDIECNLGVRLADKKRLKECTVPWAAIAPNESKVIFYQWVLALHEKDYATAQRLVARAKAVPSADVNQIQRMERATLEAMPFWRRSLKDWRFGASGLVVLFGLTAVLLRRRLRMGEPRAI